jgi:hypothetical protein
LLCWLQVYGDRRSAAARAVMTSGDGRCDVPVHGPRLLALFGGDATAMTTIWFPLTEDSPDAWNALAAEANSRWNKAHPVRAALAALVAYRHRKQGREAGWPHLLEMVERHPVQAFKARCRWLLHLARLRAEGRDDVDGNFLEDLLGN